VLVASAVQRVLADAGLRASLVQAGLARAQEFSVDAARRGLVQAVEQVLQAA
jgi:hypothetical protein